MWGATMHHRATSVEPDDGHNCDRTQPSSTLLQPFTGARPHLAAKCAGQGRRAFVADLVGDQCHGPALAQALLRQADAPAHQVIGRCRTDHIVKVRDIPASAASSATDQPCCGFSCS